MEVCFHSNLPQCCFLKSLKKWDYKGDHLLVFGTEIMYLNSRNNVINTERRKKNLRGKTCEYRLLEGFSDHFQHLNKHSAEWSSSHPASTFKEFLEFTVLLYCLSSFLPTKTANFPQSLLLTILIIFPRETCSAVLAHFLCENMQRNEMSFSSSVWSYVPFSI